MLTSSYDIEWKRLIEGVGIIALSKLLNVLTVVDNVNLNITTNIPAINGGWVIKDRKRQDVPQISLPFGKKKKEENDTKITAQREFREETGLITNPNEFTRLGDIQVETENNLVNVTLLNYKEEIDEKQIQANDEYFRHEIGKRVRTSIETLINNTDLKNIRVPTYEALLVALEERASNLKINVSANIKQLIKKTLQEPIQIVEGMYAQDPIHIKQALQEIYQQYQKKYGYH